MKVYDTILVEKKMVTGVKCDVCGKEYENEDFSISFHHDEWGNDSIDSYEYFDTCSFNCFIKKIKEIIKEQGKYETLMINDMKVIVWNNILKGLK